MKIKNFIVYYLIILTKNINLLIDDISKLENGIIFFNLKDKGLLSKKIDSQKYLTYIEFPYSYQQKRKGLMIPKNCLEKLIKKPLKDDTK